MENKDNHYVHRIVLSHTTVVNCNFPGRSKYCDHCYCIGKWDRVNEVNCLHHSTYIKERKEWTGKAQIHASGSVNL